MAVINTILVPLKRVVGINVRLRVLGVELQALRQKGVVVRDEAELAQALREKELVRWLKF